LILLMVQKSGDHHLGCITHHLGYINPEKNGITTTYYQLVI